MTPDNITTIMTRLEAIEASQKIVWRFVSIAMPVLVAGITGLIGVALSNRYDLGRYGERIEAQQQILETMPPKWLIEQVNDIKATLRGIEDRLRAIEKK